MLQELVPSAVIYPYFRMSGYAYLHIPIRLAKECGIASGLPSASFVAYIRDGRLIIEQIKEDKDA